VWASVTAGLGEEGVKGTSAAALGEWWGREGEHAGKRRRNGGEGRDGPGGGEGGLCATPALTLQRALVYSCVYMRVCVPQ
jgi:hypothetical protein